MHALFEPVVKLIQYSIFYSQIKTVKITIQRMTEGDVSVRRKDSLKGFLKNKRLTTLFRNVHSRVLLHAYILKKIQLQYAWYHNAVKLPCHSVVGPYILLQRFSNFEEDMTPF